MGSLFGGLKPKSDIPLLVKRYLDKVNCNLGLVSFIICIFTSPYFFRVALGTGTRQVCNT